MNRSQTVVALLCYGIISCAPQPPLEPPVGPPVDTVTDQAPPPSPLLPRDPLQLGKSPADASSTQVEALYWVNTFRVRAGLAPVDQVDTLNIAAAAHATFILTNGDLYEGTGVSVHEQDPTRPGFFGERFWERMATAGYDGQPFREVIAYQSRPAAAVAHWMETVYHRLPLIHPNAQHIGYAEAHLGNTRINVLDVGAGTGWAPSIPGGVVWPPDGATQVPLAWDGLENPQPPAPPAGFPSGPVVTLTFPVGTDFQIYEHRIVDLQAEASVKHVFLDAENDEHLQGEGSVALYAHEPLEPGRTYAVTLSGLVDGAVFERRWSFTTRTASECSVAWQDCGVGKACYATADYGTLCAWSGARRLGEPCEYQNDCEGGLTCVGATCRAYCLIEGGTNDCNAVCDNGWNELNAPGGYGACAL